MNTPEELLDAPASILFDRLPVPLLGVHRSGCIAAANPTMCDLVGYGAGDLVGRAADSLILETVGTAETHLTWLNRLAGRLVPLQHADGPPAFAYPSAAILLGKSGGLAVVTFDDVTEPV